MAFLLAPVAAAKAAPAQPLAKPMLVRAGHSRSVPGRGSRLACTVAASALVVAVAAAPSSFRTRHSASPGLASVRGRVQRCSRGGATDEAPAAVIVGGGRVGEALAAMGSGADVILRRGEPFPSNAPAGPIFVCTRNDALESVIEMTPKERREDLVFIQNGAILPFLERELGKDTAFTVLLVYFAVAKKGDPPLDGKTDTDPAGLTAVDAGGKWAAAVAARLQSAGLACHSLPGSDFAKAYWEKNLWIAAYMLIGAVNGGCTVGDVEAKHRSQVDALIIELATAVSSVVPGVSWDMAVLVDRLAAYARSVGHFPTAVKEFEWRNGAFVDITRAAESRGEADPCPKHTTYLRTIGAI